MVSVITTTISTANIFIEIYYYFHFTPNSTRKRGVTRGPQSIEVLWMPGAVLASVRTQFCKLSVLIDSRTTSATVILCGTKLIVPWCFKSVSNKKCIILGSRLGSRFRVLMNYYRTTTSLTRSPSPKRRHTHVVSERDGEIGGGPAKLPSPAHIQRKRRSSFACYERDTSSKHEKKPYL